VQVDFLEPWAASALRIIDNNLDISHPAFVHRGTFGDPSRALVANYEIERTAAGYLANVPQDVGGVGPQIGEANEGRRYERTQETELLGPVHTRIRLSYGGEAADYCFYGSATPLDDEHSLYVRVSALAGTEQEQPYSMFWDFSRRVTLEDKVVLEETDPDFPLDITREVHLRCDKVTLEYRRQLARLAASRASTPDLSAAAKPTGGAPLDLGQPEGGRSEPAA
jgi:phenylpropionate dioxygenase-like ring-hydroxylating dioxygenase large terminal subunit